MILKIGDRVYPAASVQQITLRQSILFDAQMQAHGLDKRWADIEPLMAGLFSQVEQLETEQERKAAVAANPDYTWVMAMIVWAARTAAGEDLSFLDAIDVPYDQVSVMPEPQDHRAAKDPRKAARPGTGRAAASKRAR